MLVVQRAVLWFRHGGDFDALLRSHPHWIIVQLQSVEALREQPLAALWYLQQSPPLPNAIVAALLQVLPWPVGVGWALVAMQALCSLAVALLLTEIGRRLLPLWAATALGAGWLLSPDVLVLETVGLGQVVYENLAALGVLACVWTLLRWMESGERRWALALGVSLGLLALTRSSYGFFSLFVLALLAASALAFRRFDNRRFAIGQIAACALVALSIQGVWSAKNLAVFGHWTWPASTWGGASLATSLTYGPMGELGAGEELASHVVASRDRREAWFVSFVEEQIARGDGVRPWTAGWYGRGHCPAAATTQDRLVDEALGGGNRPENTQCLREVSEAYGDAAMDFLLHRPDLLLRKTKLAYATYWFPLRYHGGQYLSLFEVEWRVERPLRPWRSARQLLAGELPEPAVVTSDVMAVTPGAESGLERAERRPARLFTLHLPATLWWLVELVVLHLVTPLVVLVVLWRLWRHRRHGLRGSDPAGLDVADCLVLALAATFVYSAAVHNLVELRENMRFRWTVEPVIWLLVADSLRRLMVAARAAAGRLRLRDRDA